MAPDLGQLMRDAAPKDVGLPDLDLIDQRAGRRRALRGSLWAMLIVLTVGGAAGIWWTAGRPPPEIIGPPEAYAPQWKPIPEAPLDGRPNVASVWTGDRLIVWGGGYVAPMGAHPDQEETGHTVDHDTGEDVALGEVMFRDGAEYDPGVGRWLSIADAPFESGYRTQAVWTDREMIVVTNDSRSGDLRIGAYEPSEDAWRSVDHPIGSGAAVEIVWSGKEMLLWGSFDHQASRGDIGYAYEPATDRWRELPDAPVPARQSHSAVWTGTEMIVWGGTDLTGPVDEDLGGAAYDPVTDRWRQIPSAPIPFRSDHTATWTGHEMIVWGGRGVAPVGDGAAYDPAENTWRELPPAPIQGRVYHAAAWDGRAMAIWGGTSFREGAFDDGAVYLPDSNRWATLPDAPIDGRCNAATTETPSGLILWGGMVDCEGGTPAADGALLASSLAAEDVESPPRAIGPAVLTLQGDEAEGWAVLVSRGEGDRWCANSQFPQHHGPDGGGGGLCNQVVIFDEDLAIGGTSSSGTAGLVYGFTDTADRVVAVWSDGSTADAQMGSDEEIPFRLWAYAWEGTTPAEIVAMTEGGDVLAIRQIGPVNPDDLVEEPPAAALLPGCRLLTERELATTSDGVVGLTLGPAIRAGVPAAYTLGPLAAVESDDADFVTPWTVVSALVTSNGGDVLGVATWLSPDPVATLKLPSGATVDDARDHPHSFVESTHVTAANELAERISVFEAAEEEASAEPEAERCAQAAAG